jgi:hypothetical protein
MKTIGVRVLWIGMIALALGQFFRPTVTCNHGLHKYNLLDDPKVDPEVRVVLKRSCADCHSNEARLPWYAQVSPISWLIARHIERGREKLNFSEFPRNSVSAKQEVADSVDQHEMPLPSYLLIHRDARLSLDDQEAIDRWADSSK